MLQTLKIGFSSHGFVRQAFIYMSVSERHVSFPSNNISRLTYVKPNISVILHLAPPSCSSHLFPLLRWSTTPLCCVFFFSRQQTSAETQAAKEPRGRRCSINYSAAFLSFSLSFWHALTNTPSFISWNTHTHTRSFSHLCTQLLNSCLIRKRDSKPTSQIWICDKHTLSFKLLTQQRERQVITQLWKKKNTQKCLFFQLKVWSKT